MTTEAQKVSILEYLKKGFWITPLEALTMFGCLRLGARIYDLRKEGNEIISEPYITPQGKRVAKYSMIMQ